MADDIFTTRASGKKSIDSFDIRSKVGKEQTPKSEQIVETNRGIYPSFKRGLSSGVSGLAAGYEPEEAPKDEGFFEHLASLTGELASDIPAMSVGGALGAVAGGSLGPIGAVAGSSAGAFAAPTLIKQSFAEYRDYAKNGGNDSFKDFIERAGHVGLETAKAGTIGLATGKVAKFLPLLQKIPGLQGLLNTRLGAGAAKAGLELGALTGTQAALERKMPKAQEVLDNAALLLATKASGGITKTEGAINFKDAAHRALKNMPGTQQLISLSEKMPAPVKNFFNSIESLKKNANQKIYFDMLADHVGKRKAKIVESQFKWRESLANAEEAGKLTPQNLEEMIYYRQKTGNPMVEGDTYEKLERRLPENAKKFVDQTVHQHLEDMLEAWNEHPETKKISPREGMEDVYLPGLYEYDPKLFARATANLSKRFKGKNPLSNSKVFMNYNDALIKRGLKPKYKNIVQLMQAYDNIMIKAMGNAELISKVKELEKKSGKKIIVNSANKKAYKEASANGWIPFYDPFLRRYIAGTKENILPFERTAHKLSPGMVTNERYKGFFTPSEMFKNAYFEKKKNEGKPIFATTAAPALVHPDFASAFQGVFTKDAFKPESQAWKAYDALGNKLRTVHVALSPFHYFALGEHGASTIGFKESFKNLFKRWSGEADSLLNNKEFMMDAADSGLTLYHEVEGIVPERSYIEEKIDKIAQKIPEKVKNSKIADEGLALLGKLQNHLFGEYRPRLKAVTWKNFTDAHIDKLIKQGNPPSEEQIKQIKREMAQFVNDTYGGQEFETQRFFNDPKNLKWMRRVIGYPDWSISAVKNAANAFDKGVKGETARKAWIRYGINYMAVQGMMKFLNSGWVNKDPDKSIKGLTFDINKAMNGLNVARNDPTAWYKFPLPDVDVKIAGVNFNPGRDAENRKLYSHTGKQALEIAHYFTQPMSAFFSKSNPLIQAAWKQVMGSTPYGEENFTVQGQYKYGERKPWKATEPLTMGRFVSRAKELSSEFTPFALSGISRTGKAPYVASAFGGLPISRGINTKTAIPLLEKALRSNNTQKVEQIRKLLQESGIKDKEIKRTISMVRNAVKKE